MVKLELMNRLQGMLIITILLALVGSVFSPLITYANDAVSVQIYVDGEERVVRTIAGNVSEVLADSGIDLSGNDLVEPGVLTPITGDSFHINIYRAKPVMIIDDEEIHRVMSPYQNPRLVAEHAGLDINDEDKFEVEQISDLVADEFVGNKVIVDRAMPVDIHVDRQIISLNTHQQTVEKLLRAEGIVLSDLDTVSPSLDMPILPNTQIVISRVGYETLVEEHDIAYVEQTILDDSQPKGWSEIRTPGQLGRKVSTYKVKTVDGHPASQELIQEIITLLPVTQIVVRGNLKVPPGQISGNIAIGAEMAAAKGWTGDQWTCLYRLWARESGWDHSKSNYAGSGAYGIPQALPGSKMATFGVDWATNPRTQIAWGLNYIANRYGTPCKAWSHALSVGWY